MKKLLILLLITLIFGSISCSVKDEWEKAKKTCAKVKAFLKKYDLYDDLVSLLNKSAKAAAQKICEKKFSSDLCSNIVYVVGTLTSQIHIC